MELNVGDTTSIDVKLMLMLGLLALCGAAVFGIRGRNPRSTGVGTAPGDIGTSADVLATAKARGHDLAIFAAG